MFIDCNYAVLSYYTAIGGNVSGQPIGPIFKGQDGGYKILKSLQTWTRPTEKWRQYSRYIQTKRKRCERTKGKENPFYSDADKVH